MEQHLHIESNDGKSIIGYVNVTSKQTSTIEKMVLQLYVEARGKIASQSKVIDEFIICERFHLVGNNTKKIPFVIDLSDNLVSKYHGKNVTLSHKIESHVVVNPDDYKKISLGNRVKSFFNDNTAIKQQKLIELNPSGTEYAVKESKVKLDKHAKWAYLVLLIFVVFVVSVFIFPPKELPFLILNGIGSVILALLSFGLLNQYESSIIGDVYAIFKNEGEKFSIDFTSTKKFNLKGLKSYYIIQEKVIDSRGTSSVTYTRNLFRSKKINFKHMDSDPDVYFAYPNKMGIQSNHSIYEAQINWIIFLEAITRSGRRHEFSRKFIVQLQSIDKPNV